jgi:transketolase
MKKNADELMQIARQIRIDIIKMLNKAKSGHTGGSLSAVDILASLYFNEMNIDPKDPDKSDRDRFVLSKGHAAPALYTTLAFAGYFKKEELDTLRKTGSILQGHPDMNLVPGVEMSTGSLGQGLSAANGMAMALKLNESPARVYVMMGDGELQEGQIWEAAMTAHHYKLDNLCAFVDSNGLQIDGEVEKIMGIEPLADKWRAFGWHVIKIDGHDVNEILGALDEARRTKEKPTVIVAKTIKGKGFSFCEGKVGYHGIPPSDKDLEEGLKEINALEA